MLFVIANININVQNIKERENIQRIWEVSIRKIISQININHLNNLSLKIISSCQMMMERLKTHNIMIDIDQIQ